MNILILVQFQLFFYFYLISDIHTCWVKNSCITNSFVSKIEHSFKSIVLKKEKKQALYSPAIPIFTTGVPNNDQKKYEIKRTITNRFYLYCPIQIIKTYIQKIALDVVYEFKRSYSVQISKYIAFSYQYSFAFSILLA